MNVAVVAALAVALMSSVIGPVLVVWLTGKQRRVEKQQDYDRQDEVVAAAAAAATAAQTAAAANLVANQQTADSLEGTNAKLDVIHTLVNSNMTTAMQNELDATVRELALMQELMRFNAAAGQEPTVEVLAAIDATEAKIAELRTALADRHRQAELAAEQTG